MRKKFTLLLASLLCCVGVVKAAVTDLPQLSTDGDIKWYTIKNVRGNAFARYDGDGGAIKLTPTVESNAYLFYFTEGTTAGTYKIHNSVNELLCAAPDSWTKDGLDWYIAESGCSSHPGLAISKESTLTATGSEAWNDYQNSHKSVAWYGGNDAGSTWEIAPYESAAPTIQFSTEDNIVLHYIRSNRRDSYVNFDGHNSTFKEGNLGAGSYWYFVQDTEAQKNAPEGFVACRIFNAAHATGVENYTTGFMGTDQWPARVHYIGFRENDNYGYVIYRADEDGTKGWHDYSGTHIGAFSVGDNGSLWRIYPSGKAVADLIAEAKSVVDNMIGLLPAAKEASYYSYSEQGIEAIEAAIASFDENNLASALTSAMTIGNAQKTGAPAAGDFIILKNKAKNEYMTTMESGDEVHRTSDKNNPKALWQVVAGEDSKVKLYNVASEKYLGALGQSAKVLMVEETDAAQFTFSNVADMYAAFTSGGGSYTYAHMDGWYDRVVGWEAAADASQWIVTNVRPLSITYLYNDKTLDTTNEYAKVGTYTVSSPYAFTKPIAYKKGEEDWVTVDGVFSLELTEATTLTVKLGNDLPFVPADDYASIKNWYYIQMHSSGGSYSRYIQAMADHIEWLDVDMDVAEADSYTWGFVGNPFDGFKLVNYGAGGTKAVSSTGSDNPALGSFETGTQWTIKTSRTNPEAQYFCFQYPGSNNYMNAQNGKIAFYDDNDQGSTMWVTERDLSVAIVGDKSYATLQAAITAAEAEETIELINDITLEQAIDINKVVTLNRNGKTITRTGEGYAFEVTGELILKGAGSINGGIHYTINDNDYKQAGKAYAMSADKVGVDISYIRTFGHTNWQVLYVPFDIPVASMSEFDVYSITNASGNAVVVDQVTEGPLTAHTPYLIKAKSTGDKRDKTISVKNGTLKATPENDYSQVIGGYTFTGTYAAKQITGYNEYVLTGGEWCQLDNSNQVLGAFRVYLTVDGSAAPVLRIMTRGEEDTTAIDSAVLNAQPSSVIYDLLGRRVEKMDKGIYIVNGRKVVVK